MKTTKICTKCNQEKELSEFSIRDIKRQYYKSQCKNCDRLYRQENVEAIRIRKKIYNDKNKEKIAIQTKKYREANREAVLESRRNYKAKNKEKVRASDKEYRRKNSDKIKEYREKNKEKAKEYDREYYEKNKESITKRCKEYYINNKQVKKEYAERNRDKINAKRREYYFNNKNLFREKQREYRKTEKGKIVHKNSINKRRAKIRVGRVRTEDLQLLIKNSKTCYWCNTKLNNDYHIDHYIPLSKGGIHTIDNIVISCPDCNLEKNIKDPYQFAVTKGKLL